MADDFGRVLKEALYGYKRIPEWVHEAPWSTEVAGYYIRRSYWRGFWSGVQVCIGIVMILGAVLVLWAF